MLFMETVVVYCENHTEHINTLCVDRMPNLMVFFSPPNQISVYNIHQDLPSPSQIFIHYHPTIRNHDNYLPHES
jgi:hypothetical protein